MIDLEFNKIDLAIHEQGPHLRPSEVADNPEAALLTLRSGPSLTVSALDLDFGPVDSETLRHRFAALCRFAKGLTVAVLSVPAAPRDTPFEAEVERLKSLVDTASREGLVLSVTTHRDTLTAFPDETRKLCEAVPGLGLNLDPSHYLNGPYQSDEFDELFPYVRNVQLRDTGRKPGEFQVRVGQGQIEYGRIVNMLDRVGYDRCLSVAIVDRPENDFDVELEVRKLKLLLESLL
jgi:sugar phosphate isomerase/epimerase